MIILNHFKSVLHGTVRESLISSPIETDSVMGGVVPPGSVGPGLCCPGFLPRAEDEDEEDWPGAAGCQQEPTRGQLTAGSDRNPPPSPWVPTAFPNAEAVCPGGSRAACPQRF